MVPCLHTNRVYPHQPRIRVGHDNHFTKSIYNVHLVHDHNTHNSILTQKTFAVNLLASHQCDPGSVPGWVSPYFRMWESCRTMPLVGGYSRGSPVSPAL
ncbi:hypothetical protein PR048_028644 [Dryococelus australis]|uniref:Uncharacterized protein n=1 Tax=Dryococelus australis TaxID=614101 RepID=A0ABQ9GDP6_9NEOP|nr:hypothetical protein PR048_028644 [Dryococelus australis]